MKKGFFFLLNIVFLFSFSINYSSDELGFSRVLHLRPSLISGENKTRADNADLKFTNNPMLNMLSQLPLYFVENRGQMDEKARYYAKTSKGTIFFTGGEIVYQFIHGRDEGRSQKAGVDKQGRAERENFKVENIRVRFVGANSSVKVQGLEEAEARHNYFLGNDPKEWVRGARSYHKVIYRQLYPGIDLVVYGKERRIKNEYVVKAGAEVGKIGLRIEGAKALRINGRGQIEAKLEKGFLLEDAPLSYQVINGKRVEVKTWYWIDKDNVIRLEVGEYRRNKELIVDPLVYSTYLGGSTYDGGYGIALDASGNAYVTGNTTSTDFPTTAGAFDMTHNGAADVFVIKLNSAGTGLVFSTYLGGNVNEYSYGIAVAADGTGTYVTGYTSSTNFPVTITSYDPTHNGGKDAFITKLNSAGTNIVFSTFLGGSNDDMSYGIDVDGSGNGCIIGETSSTDFPTTAGSYDPTHNGGKDAFITKLGSAGTSLVFSTFLGGSNDDLGRGIDVDGIGNGWLIGETSSTDFPTTAGAYDMTHNGSEDAFITNLNAAGTGLVFSTYLGGWSVDIGYGIAVDQNGAYVAGYTTSTNFPTTAGAYDTTHNGAEDAFLAKINAVGTGLVLSTYLGGSSNDCALGMAVDIKGNAFVRGKTNSADFPATSGAYDTSHNGGYDAFLSVVNGTGTSLLYSTYLGGSGNEYSRGITLDIFGNAYVTGETDSSNFPTTSGAYDTSYGGITDAFISKVSTMTYMLIPFGSLDNGNVNMGNSGDSTANVNLKIIDTSGSLVGQDNFTIPARGVVRSWDRIENIYSYGKPVTVEIWGDQPLVGDNIKWADPPYDTVGAGFTCGPLGLMKGKEFYFPFSSFGGWANGYCVIANITDMTAVVEIKVYDSAGGLRKSVSSTIGARGVVRSWDIIGSIQAIADPALIWIGTDQDVVVEAVRWEQNTRGWGFAIFPCSPYPAGPGASFEFFIPFGSLDNGNVNMGNTGDSTSNVTLNIIDNSGSVVKTESFTIPGKGVVRSLDMIGNIYSYGKPVTVEIISSQLLVGDNIKWANAPYPTVGAGFSCGALSLMKGKTFYFPFSSFGGWANAYCVMANTASSTANVTIDVYNSSGTLMATVNFLIGGRGVARSWDTLGSIQAIADPALLKITSSQDLVVEAVRWEQNKRGWGFAILPVK